MSNIFSPCLKIIERLQLNKYDLYHKNSPDDWNFYFSCEYIGQSRRKYLKIADKLIVFDTQGFGKLIEDNFKVDKLIVLDSQGFEKLIGRSFQHCLIDSP